MTNLPIRPQGLLARIVQFLLDTSEAAVAVHYRQPWTDEA